MILIEVDPVRRPLMREGVPLASVYTVLVEPGKLGASCAEALQRGYGREELILKVLRAPAAENVTETRWGGRRGEGWDESPFRLAAMAQNVLAREGLAPRVYGIVRLVGPDRDWAAQVVELQHGTLCSGFTREQRDRAESVLALRGITGCFRGATRRDWVGGKFVDCQCCQVDESAYRAYTRDACAEASPWRGTHGKPYQDAPGLEGVRGEAQVRADVMRWTVSEFGSASVLDLGCSTGGMLRVATQMGAVRVVGVDRPEVVGAACDVANLEGCWNHDYLGIDLRKAGWLEKIKRQTGVARFDVALFLSMDRVCGYDAEVARAAHTLYVESHPGQRRSEWEARLLRHWGRVEFLGTSEDRHKRWLWRCTDGRQGI